MAVGGRPASLFANRQEANFRSCVKMVESVIAHFGIDPDHNRLKTASGQPAWGMRRGSAAVYIFLQPGETANVIQVVSPVVKLPAEGREGFFRRVLELNATELIGAGFGVRGDDLVITSDRITTDIEASEIQEMIRRVGAYADRFDDEFAQQFGARRHSDA